MRTIIALGAALIVAGTAEAQGPGAPYPAPHGNMGMQMHQPPLPQPPRANVPSRRWGSQVGGRWWGGANAPGGWAAYRRPYRGYRLPGYWVAPRFYVSDWSRYGLYAPSGGYNWIRYYDDAVLVDQYGGVSDWRGGLNWDGYDEGDDYYAGDERRSNGVGGAVAGAVVGGVAGNVIAGRGDRLGGTLIGAGVGAVVGYGVDRAADRDRRGPPPGYDRYRDERGGPPPPPPPLRDDGWRDGGAGYPLPPGHPPVGPQHGPSSWTSADGRTTVTTTTSGGYGGAPVIVNGGGYGYGGGYGGGVTTITVQTAPVVTTTTTTEIIEDTVTYRRPVVRRAVRHRVWHARPRPRCVCGS